MKIKVQAHINWSHKTRIPYPVIINWRIQKRYWEIVKKGIVNQAEIIDIADTFYVEEKGVELGLRIVDTTPEKTKYYVWLAYKGQVVWDKSAYLSPTSFQWPINAHDAKLGYKANGIVQVSLLDE